MTSLPVSTVAAAADEAPSARGAELAGWARARLREELGGPKATCPAGTWCEQPGATFVTLRWPDGDLQGCIGSIEAVRPLVEDVARNAVAAGTRDPRARPITLADVDRLDLELSILSPLQALEFDGEEQALAALRPGRDGVVLGHQGHRATFLPVMWETFGDAHTLLRALKNKAGLRDDFWAGDLRIWRYTVERFEDPAPDRAGSSPPGTSQQS